MPKPGCGLPAGVRFLPRARRGARGRRRNHLPSRRRYRPRRPCEGAWRGPWPGPTPTRLREGLRDLGTGFCPSWECDSVSVTRAGSKTYGKGEVSRLRWKVERPPLAGWPRAGFLRVGGSRGLRPSEAELSPASPARRSCHRPLHRARNRCVYFRVSFHPMAFLKVWPTDRGGTTFRPSRRLPGVSH